MLGSPKENGDGKGKCREQIGRDIRAVLPKAQECNLRPPDHVPALDGIRGLAILLVIAFHANLIEESPAAQSLDLAFARLANVGWCGVDLFFALSGFLITGILYDAKGESHYFRNFYLRRVLRIFPLYYGVLFLALVVIPNLPSGIVPVEKLDRFARVEGETIWFWFYLSNFSTAVAGAWRHGILDVTWSLAIEEQFYVIWPVVVMLLSREKLMLICVTLFFGALFIRIAMALAECNPLAIYVVTPARMDVISAGAFVALAVRGPRRAAPWLRDARRAWFASATLLVLVFLWRNGFGYGDLVVQTFGFSLIAVNGASLVLLAFGSRPTGLLVRCCSAPLLRAFGKYSYGIYFINKPVLAAIRDIFYGREQFLTLFGSQIPGQLIFYAAVTAVTFGCAFASWHLYEKHFLRLKRFARATSVETKSGDTIAPEVVTLPVAEGNPAMPLALTEVSSKDRHIQSR